MTNLAELALTRFNERNSEDKLRLSSSVLKSKVDICPYEVFLISASSTIKNSMGFEKCLSEILIELGHACFQLFNKDKVHESNYNQAIKTVKKHGENIYLELNAFGVYLFRFRHDTKKNKFFILLNKPDGLFDVALRTICNIWQLDQGNIPLHASGIIHCNGIYLFSGPSHAGKSTIGILSLLDGKELLDEDQVMIYRNTDSGYSANAWGKTLRRSKAPLRAFFRIVKSQTNMLMPLSKVHMAKLILEQSYEITGSMITKKHTISLVKWVAELTRSIPGFELHFRKSADFWELIDVEIPIG